MQLGENKLGNEKCHFLIVSLHSSMHASVCICLRARARMQCGDNGGGGGSGVGVGGGVGDGGDGVCEFVCICTLQVISENSNLYNTWNTRRLS